MQVLYLILNRLHLWRVSGRLLERLRLRPTQREQQRVEQQREDNDRESVVRSDAVEEIKRVQDRDRERFGQPAEPPIVTEVDQIDERYRTAISGLQASVRIAEKIITAQLAQNEIVFRTRVDLSHRTVGCDRHVRRHEMARFGRLCASDHPPEDVLVDRLNRDVILRRAIFNRADWCRRDRSHRKVRVAHRYPLDRAVVCKRRLIVGVVRERVVAPMAIDVALDRRDCFRFGLINIVIIDLVIADACTDRELSVGNRLSVPNKCHLQVADVTVCRECENFLDLDRLDSSSLGHRDLIAQRKLDRLRFVSGKDHRIAIDPGDFVILFVEYCINVRTG